MGSAVRALLLLRHAAAEPGHGHPDRDRALTPAGRQAARMVADWLRDRGTLPDLVLCSPARRARQTLDALFPAFGGSAEVRLAESLYRGDTTAVLEQVRAVAEEEERVLVVGHNPSLAALAQWLAATADRGQLASFPPGALALLTASAAWADVGEGSMGVAAFQVPDPSRYG
jgi:phosphohistidine phosphatase